MSVIERERVEAPQRVVTEADVLERAADLLEEFGWCQGGTAFDANGVLTYALAKNAVSFCAGGAIIRASVDLGLVGNGSWDLVPRSLSGIPSWNDDPGRTKTEVVARLREAAARARAEA